MPGSYDHAHTLGLVVKLAKRTGVMDRDLPQETALELAQAMSDAGVEVLQGILSPSTKCTLIPCDTLAQEDVIWEKERWTFRVKPGDDALAERLEGLYSTLEDRLNRNQGEGEWDLPAADNTDKVKDVDRIPQKQNAEDAEDMEGFNGRRANRLFYEVTAKPDYARQRKHTESDLHFYAKMKKKWLHDPEVEPEWAWRRDLMLSDEVMNRLNPNEWLRGMLVLNGLSTNALEDVTGIPQSDWKDWSNDKKITYRGAHTLTHTNLEHGLTRSKRALRILPGPLLGLSVLQDGTIDPAATSKIMQKLGYYEPNLLLAGVAAVAEAHKDDAVATEELRGVFAAMAGALLPSPLPYNLQSFVRDGVAAGRIKRDNTRDGNDFYTTTTIFREMNEAYWRIPAEIFELRIDSMQNLPKKQKSNAGLLFKPLEPEEAFEFAKARAETIGQFLEIYREARHIPRPEIVKRDDTTKQNISFQEKSDQLRSSRLLKILDKNIYDLPVGSDGKVPQGIQDYLKELNKAGEKKKAGGRTGFPKPAPEHKEPEEWLTIRQVLKEQKQLYAWSRESGSRALTPNPEMEPYIQAWGELTKEARLAAGQEREIAGGIQVRCGKDGELRVHTHSALQLMRALQTQHASKSPTVS